MMVFRVFIFLILLTSCNAYVDFGCVGTCYSGLLSPKKEQIYPDKYIKGHSYKNVSHIDFKKCYSICKQDCRCKACQMKGGNCELLDADTTFCRLKLHNGPGYVFYDLEQTKIQGKSYMNTHNGCFNGCCRSQPCQNGGTCQETCHDPKQKFTCRCKGIYSGTLCERKVSSCEEIAKNEQTLSHGQRTIYRIDTGAALTVYCDFTTPKQAWTLIESFYFRNNAAYNAKPFFVDFPRNTNHDSILWGDFRLPLNTMKYLSSSATQYRATCRFLKKISAGVSLKRDSLIGSLKDYHIVLDDSHNVGQCVIYKYINIRGREHFNQSASTWHSSTYHFHLDSKDSCDGFTVADKIHGEEFFGWYDPQNPSFSCVETPDSSTNWWLGGEFHKCF